MATIRYLAYGSNLHPSRIGARVGAITAIGTTSLPGWRLRFHKYSGDGSGKCNLAVDRSSIAFGAIYELSHRMKERLDEIEGVGNGYRDTKITLPGFGDTWIYLAEPSHIKECALPYDWYHGFVLKGAELNYFPNTYITEIRDVQAIQDPNENRRNANLSILRSI
ncbi:MAG TPA: gamma-glutamylcyclotransferase [Gammaproteobacteria bacterium]|nr:gamma-glutamylcyclotransferase [Gammaproteobacteria bacterium]|tara:strand:- start:645 stop:1139 length:495 start_codon:yes stop_codon:yes gene_type:complete